MYWESVVMVSTMVDLMRDHGIPSLAVHDSLIVPRSAINIAATALRASFRSVTQHGRAANRPSQGAHCLLRTLRHT